MADIHTTGRLVIGVKGRVEGNVDCQDCESQGVVTGNLRVVRLLTLKASSAVNGEIRYGRMAVEAGARIEGVCKLDDVSGEEETTEPPVKNLDHAGQALQQAPDSNRSVMRHAGRRPPCSLPLAVGLGWVAVGMSAGHEIAWGTALGALLGLTIAMVMVIRDVNRMKFLLFNLLTALAALLLVWTLGEPLMTEAVRDPLTGIVLFLGVLTPLLERWLRPVEGRAPAAMSAR